MTVVNGGRDEVELLDFLIALEAGGHGGTSSLHPTLRKVAKDGAPELFGRTNKGGAPGKANSASLTFVPTDFVRSGGFIEHRLGEILDGSSDRGRTLPVRR